MSSPPQINESCNDMDRESKIAMNGLTGRTEIIMNDHNKSNTEKH